MITLIILIFYFNLTKANTEIKPKRFCGTIPLSIGKCGEKCEYYFNHYNKTL